MSEKPSAPVRDRAREYHARINDPLLTIDARCPLVVRGAGPVGWPGSAEVVNMQPREGLIRQGINSLPTLGDGRQSGTSASPSILNASPESAVGGGLAWLRTDDMVRIDLNSGRCDVLLDDGEISRRKAAAAASPPPVLASQTPWQEIYFQTVGQLDSGGCMDLAFKYRAVGQDLPQHNY